MVATGFQSRKNTNGVHANLPGVLKGRNVAGLGACEPKVTAVGGIYIDVKPTEAYVDGNMVSAKGWTGLAAFMRECLNVLGTKKHPQLSDRAG